VNAKIMKKFVNPYCFCNSVCNGTILRFSGRFRNGGLLLGVSGTKNWAKKI